MKILRDKQVADVIGQSRATVWRRSKLEADFPKPVKVSRGVTGWVEQEVQAWLTKRVSESRNAGA